MNTSIQIEIVISFRNGPLSHSSSIKWLAVHMHFCRSSLYQSSSVPILLSQLFSRHFNDPNDTLQFLSDCDGKVLSTAPLKISRREVKTSDDENLSSVWRKKQSTNVPPIQQRKYYQLIYSNILHNRLYYSRGSIDRLLIFYISLFLYLFIYLSSYFYISIYLFLSAYAPHVGPFPPIDYSHLPYLADLKQK